jgi:hypothetical protein
VAARLANDGEYLYLQLEEQADPRKLKTTDDVAGGDYWEVIVAGQRAAPYRKLRLAPLGRNSLTEHAATGTVPWDAGLALNSDVSRPDRWIVTVALPLTRLVPGGVKPGATVYLNVARRSGVSDDQPLWVPTFGEFDDPSALREVKLDGPETIPTQLPSAAELRRLSSEGLVARWTLGDGQGTVARSVGGEVPGKLVNGATWVKDGARTVVRLEESRQQCVDFGSPEAVSLTGSLALMLWVKYAPSDVWYPALIGKGYEASGTYGLHLRPGLTPWFEIDAPDGTRYMYNPTDLCLTPDAWTHVAATYDGQTMRVYVNGRAAGAGRQVATTIRTNTEPLRIGWLGSYGYLGGQVRDAALYRRALAWEEIFAQYLAGK